MDRILIKRLQLPLHWGLIPYYLNIFIGICSRSQVSVYRTIGPLVKFPKCGFSDFFMIQEA